MTIVVVNFTYLIYEKILAERVGYKTAVRPNVTESCMYIRGYSRVLIQVSTHSCSQFNSSKTKVIFREIKVKN